jgi:LacI family transcriptional regulator
MSVPEMAGPRMRTGMLAVLVPLIYDLYFAAILSGITEAAYEHGVRLVLSPTLHEQAREADVLDQLMDGGADGALIILPEASARELEVARSGAYPIAVIDPLMALDADIPAVTAAHASGAEQAMHHLLGLGHRRIAAITGPPGWLATEERRGAYLAALARAGLAADPALIVESDFEVAPGAAAAAALLELPEPPTAVFAFSDAIAVGTMHAAFARGLRVPEDLSIVGFDDITYATVVVPALTTVRQPLAEMGRTGVSLMLRLLDGPTSEVHQIELATKLVVRDSSAPPPARGAGRLARRLPR